MVDNGNVEMSPLIGEAQPPSGSGAIDSGTNRAGRTTSEPRPAPDLVTPNHAEGKIFIKLLMPWIGTIISAIVLVVVVRIYEAKHIITSAQKDAYNLLTIAWILLLGLNFFVSLPLTLNITMLHY
jgi:hypothetical protein